jgi:hypothetical protein
MSREPLNSPADKGDGVIAESCALLLLDEAQEAQKEFYIPITSDLGPHPWILMSALHTLKSRYMDVVPHLKGVFDQPVLNISQDPYPSILPRGSHLRLRGDTPAWIFLAIRA